MDNTYTKKEIKYIKAQAKKGDPFMQGLLKDIESPSFWAKDVIREANAPPIFKDN